MENTEINFKNYSFDDIQLVPTHDLNLERKWKYIERLRQRVFHSQNDGYILFISLFVIVKNFKNPKQIIEKHNGLLRVESEPSKTVFSVELPIPQS